MTKRILAVLLAAIMVLSLATACDSGKTESSTPVSAGESETGTSSVDLGVKRDISIGIGQNVFITDYEDNWLTKKLEEDLNCEIEMVILPSGKDGLSKVQLMINAGDDVPNIFAFPISGALMYQYGSGGTFAALNDYFDNPEITPWFHAIESEEDKNTMLAAATAADGNIYSVPMFQPETWNMTPYRTFINQKWLDNLGLKMPTTTDELLNVLKAFREKDPNGNGVEDEIPVLANYVDDGAYGRNVILSIINYFTYVPPKMSSLSLSEDGKNVIAPQVTDGWKEAMSYLHSLYEVGAILPNGTFVQGSDTGFKGALNYQANGTTEAPAGKSVNIVGFFSAGSTGSNFPNCSTDENVNFLEYRLVSPLKSASCPGYNPYAVPGAGNWWFVTDSAEDPAFCTMVGDYFYKPEMSTAVRYGAKDDDWTDDPKFCADWYEEHTAFRAKFGQDQKREDYRYVVGINGKNVWSENNNSFWHNEQPRYCSLDTLDHHQGNWLTEEQRAKYKAYYNDTVGDTQAEYYGKAHPKYLLPELKYTADEQAQITEFQVAFPEEVMSWTMKFITGEISTEKDWDAYVDALNALGLEDYVKCSQAAYERSVYYEANFK